MYNSQKLLTWDNRLLQECGFTSGELKAMLGNDPTKELREVPELALQAYEHYDYVVMLFRDSRDWLRAMELMGIKSSNYSSTNRPKVGLGRVVDGADILERLTGVRGSSVK